MNKANGTLQLVDLGDAVTETKQASPWPPTFADSTYGMGSQPDREDG